MVKTLQVPLGEHKKPHIFIKVNTDSSRYRLSTNYEFLNKHYNLKIQYIRDLMSIDHIIQFHNIFGVLDSSMLVNIRNYESKFSLDVNEENEENEEETFVNVVNCYRWVSIDKLSTIIVVERIFNEITNHSLFFCSTDHHSFNEFLHNDVLDIG